MTSGYVDTLLVVRKAIFAGAKMADGWKSVVDHMADEIGPELATRLRGLDVAAEVERLKVWLRDVFAFDPPPRTICGLRFGLFHPERNGEPSCDLCLCGSVSFDTETDAWSFDSSYVAQTQPHSRILNELYQVSTIERFAENAAVDHVALWFAALALADIFRDCSTILPSGSKVAGLGVGFDGGDLVVLGKISKSKFVPFSYEERQRRPKRIRLSPGDYFKLEGGRNLLMCQCTDCSIPKELFRSCCRIDAVSLTAEIDPDWPNQSGTLGSLSPFNVEFLKADAAEKLDAAFPGELQFHELAIQGSSERWRVMQVLQSLKCYDRATSDSQQRLTLFQNVAAGHNFFFVAGYYTGSAVIVSRAAVQLMIDVGVTGAEYIPVATT